MTFSRCATAILLFSLLAACDVPPPDPGTVAAAQQRQPLYADTTAERRKLYRGSRAGAR
ncbi:MAG: hypothetical protein WAO69_09625 [Aestuariivita sp.]|uniref:hypothetical protein n=1 Tax=Aestuariivita sp. TaxID=1872407 RepID=UPI003BB07B53